MVVDQARKEVVVACMGDQRLLRYALTKIGKEWVVTNVVEMVPLLGAPSALSVESDSGDVIAWATESRTLARYTRDNGKLVSKATQTFALEKPLDPVWKHGRELFHTANDNISTLGFACAHCHPDGHDDDVLWSTPRGKRRPMSLVDLPETGPYGWDSQSPTLERHVKETITIHLVGAGLSDPDMAALVTFVRSLHRTGDARIGDGQKAFEKADCSKCHDPGRAYGDSTPHLLAKDLNVRTPRLYGLGGRRTYFHDGRYSSLDALLADRTVAMGEAAALSPDEKKALIGFLESL
jgi:cytochrome c peroxidase